MNQGNKAMKIFVIFMLSLTLTAGYAQVLPDLIPLVTECIYPFRF